MKRCPYCKRRLLYRSADGRLICHACGRRFSWTSAWSSLMPRRIGYRNGLRSGCRPTGNTSAVPQVR
ncbi:Trm112 family protein [Ferrovibrio sp.]|uniref:Trm112 family protein n=1 Tax=Ferrovibrio sp. TaxID=1917215 RepID=UPI003D0AF75D